MVTHNTPWVMRLRTQMGAPDADARYLEMAEPWSSICRQ